MTELEAYEQPVDVRPWIRDMESAWNLARRLESAREFVPTELQGRGEAIMALILTGLELDMGPLWALRNLHVVNGRVAMSAEGMRALVFRAGHTIWPIEQTDQRVVMAGRRRGDDRDPVTVEWTAHRAQTAGLTGNPSWRKYPRAMLTARATAELCRVLFPDVIAGMSSDDELQTVNGASSSPGVSDGSASVRRRRPPAAIPEAAPDAEPAAAEPISGSDTANASASTAADASAAAFDSLLQPDATPEVPSVRLNLTSDDAELARATAAPPPEQDDELKVRRRLFAQLRDALPDMTQADRERYRHALTALVTRAREAPTVHFGATTLAERTELAARIADLRTGKVLAHTEPDGRIWFTSHERAAVIDLGDDDQPPTIAIVPR